MIADTVSKEIRSRIMASVRQENTKPELVVRFLLHRMGFRFRLHRKNLPGSPDILLQKYCVAIFVHGCFWHQHPGCPLAKRPASNTEYWNHKLDENIKRDKLNIRKLRKTGWRVSIIWQCKTNNLITLERKLKQFLK